MAKAKNIVLAGDYKKCSVSASKKSVTIVKGFKLIQLNSETVESYQIQNQSSNTSFVSGLVKSAVGGSAFGVAGAMAGSVSAKKKDIILVDIRFRDGKQSLIEINGNIYNQLIIQCYPQSTQNVLSDSVQNPSTPYQTKKKHKGLKITLAVIAFMLLGSFFLTSLGDKPNIDESNIKEVSQENKEIHNADMLIDATKYSNISLEDLISLNGEPENVDDWSYNDFVRTGYEYTINGHTFIFMVSQDNIVIGLDVTGEWKEGQSELNLPVDETICQYLNIIPGENMEIAVQNPFTIRLENVNDNIDTVWFASGSLQVHYDGSQYY